MYELSFYEALMKLNPEVKGEEKLKNMQYLKPKEVTKRWNFAITPGTLANWRSQKKGPPFIRFGSRVLYPLDKLEKWEGEQVGNYKAALNDNDER